ncbi:MAG: 4-phosphopantetheinyl transferase [Thermoanaerobaculia bacterium]|jgi:4'-phosphopantetheinyl transferase|nr:4-phosphopantetheinyl transferase [Thermoanaerobaculia bacterium]
MIEVFFIDIRVPRDVIDALAALLTDTERARASRYRFDDDRRRSIVARAATRRMIGRAIGSDPRTLTIVEEEHGKPALPGHEIEFNASHSGDLVALTLAATPVGIDIERRRALHAPLTLARRFFSPAEFAYVSTAADLASAFFRVWTAKEAIVKASGKGIGASDLRGFTVPFGERRWAHVTGNWSVISIDPPLPDYYTAVAAAGDVESVISRTVDAASLV